MASAASLPPAASTFRDSMPERYLQAFEPADVREHAAIVSRRAGAPAYVELWRRLPQGDEVCVVADDRPGLLSFISAALVSSGMDILSAQAFTRRAGAGRPAEAVDFFRLARDAEHPMPVLGTDIARITGVLADLVSGAVTLEDVVRRARPRRRPARAAATRVRFEEGAGADLSELVVETSDRPGLFLAITQALYRAEVQILASDARSERGRVTDHFTIAELSGAPVRAARRGLVQMEVLSAIDDVARG
jgi:UTP:GlnB (protein PII) uridylyltransferase